jgi:dTDP-4-amino-4,6-dideoxygalactose transaminase/acetyltransferase-like isoleucine patch superfamily enzyme
MLTISDPSLGSDEIQAVTNVLKSGMLVQGSQVARFEQIFADYAGTKHAVALNSGTAALHLALLAAGVGEGDEVITTPFSFVSTANAVLFCGARPVFVDIDKETFNINPRLLRQAITPRTKAVIIVHLYGQPCEMDQITRICGEHNLTLVEDACQAHGAEYRGRKVGSFGIGCFSFYATKNITTGEGGMITTDNADIARQARLLRSHGQSEKYLHQILGFNFRMTDIAAACGICQMDKLDEFNDRRIRNAAFLAGQLAGIEGLAIPIVGPDRKHVFHQFTVRVTDRFGMSRDELATALKERGIMTGVHYPIPIHKQPLYQKLGYDGSFPVSEQVAGETLSLPVHPGLSDQDLNYIVRSVREAHNGRHRQQSCPCAAETTHPPQSSEGSCASAPHSGTMAARLPQSAVVRGQVHLGEGTVVEENVVLGHRDDGVLSIGPNSRIRSGTVIYSDVSIGKGFKTGHNVLIREGTEMGDDVLVGTNTVVDGHCRVGNGVAMQTNVYLTAYTVVEDGVFLGPCSVTTNDKYMEYGARLTGATIKSGARIGANSTILPGITIGEKAVVGSGAVVTKDVPSGAVVVGNPAQRIRSKAAPRSARESLRQGSEKPARSGS